MSEEQARILVVEDDPHIAADIALRLRILGYQVLGPVQAAREAIHLAEIEKPDLVLMDIVLPGDMDGIAAATCIQRMSIPVIYLTAHTNDELLQRAKITEPLGYLVKPYSERELKAVIVMALYRHDVERQLAEAHALASRAQQQADAHQRMLSTLLGNLPGMAYRCAGQAESAMLFVSDGCYSLTGFKTDQLMSGEINFHERIHPDDRDHVWDVIEHTAPGTHFQVEYRLLHADGRVRWVWEQGCGVLDQRGVIEFYEGFITDISEQKQAAMLLRAARDELQQKVEERTRHLQEVNEKLEREMAERKRKEAELADSQGQLQAILDNAPTVIFVKDLEGRYRLVNRIWERLTHNMMDDALGKKSGDFMPAEIAGPLVENDKQVLRAEKAMDFEEIVLVEGEPRTYVCTKFPMYSSEGKLYGLGGIATDITARKQTEIALVASEAKYRALMEKAADAILIADLTGQILDANRRTQEMLGYSKEQLTDLTYYNLLPADEHAKARQYLDLLVQGETVIYEGHLITRQEVIISVEIHGSVIDCAGQRMAQCMIRDVRERRRYEERRLEQERQHRDSLVREVHHRIKNNLQGVIGLLRQQAKTHPELGDAVEAAISQVQSVSIVHGLHASNPNRQVRLCDMVTEICRTSSVPGRMPTWPSLSIEIDMPVNVQAEDAVSIALVINELVANACKHGRPAPEQAPATVRVYRVGTEAWVEVVNPGALPAVFDFSSGVGSGTGLRLLRSLLPHKGAQLDIRESNDGQVVASLRLTDPVIQN